MKKRLQRKWGKGRVYVNDPRFFLPDDMSAGRLATYAVWIGKKVTA